MASCNCADRERHDRVESRPGLIGADSKTASAVWYLHVCVRANNRVTYHTAASPPKGHCVYVIAADGTPFCKVGRTGGVTRRLAEMQSGCPHRLRLVCALTITPWHEGRLVANTAELEVSVHKLLRERLKGFPQAKGGSEWFDVPEVFLSECFERLEALIDWMLEPLDEQEAPRG